MRNSINHDNIQQNQKLKYSHVLQTTNSSKGNSVLTTSSSGAYNFKYLDDNSNVQSDSTISIQHNINNDLVPMINTPNHKTDLQNK